MRPHPAQAAVASAMLLSLGCRASFIHTAQMTIFSAAAQEKYIPGSAEPARNRSMILEFKVADVDADNRRLQPLVKTWVKPQTTQPWGIRSIYLRDASGAEVEGLPGIER
jgi:uncharacterized glyoxalase superfamily protein PhnB